MHVNTHAHTHAHITRTHLYTTLHAHTHTSMGEPLANYFHDSTHVDRYERERERERERLRGRVMRVSPTTFIGMA